MVVSSYPSLHTNAEHTCYIVVSTGRCRAKQYVPRLAAVRRAGIVSDIMPALALDVRSLTQALHVPIKRLPWHIFLNKAECVAEAIAKRIRRERADMSAADLDECMLWVNSQPWPVACRVYLLSELLNVAPCCSVRGNSDIVMQVQDLRGVENLFTHTQWARLCDEKICLHSKIDLVALHMVRLGVPGPSARLAQVLAGIIVASHYRPEAVKRTTPMVRYCILQNVLHKYNEFLTKFPLDITTRFLWVADLRHTCPRRWHNVFGDELPVRCPFGKLESVIKAVPSAPSIAVLVQNKLILDAVHQSSPAGQAAQAAPKAPVSAPAAVSAQPMQRRAWVALPPVFAQHSAAPTVAVPPSKAGGSSLPKAPPSSSPQTAAASPLPAAIQWALPARAPAATLAPTVASPLAETVSTMARSRGASHTKKRPAAAVTIRKRPAAFQGDAGQVRKRPASAAGPSAAGKI